jgi:uncharacterized membrane protein YidH (DUF202 family)
MDAFIGKVDTVIINPLIGFLFALAVLYFIYGVAQFIFNPDNEEQKTTGKSHMMWGIIGITIMMGVWTLLNVMLKTFNITGVNPKQGTVSLPAFRE